MHRSVINIERFRPPVVTAHEIIRLRLLDRLTTINVLGAAQCTLVTGPAGFGKTTLLSQAYRQVVARGDPAFWLDCSEQDADPNHFLDSLYAAAAAMGLNTEDWSYTTADFARRVAVLGPAVHLFFDDFERLIGSAAEPVVERLLLVLPEAAHLVLGSRQRPHSWFLERELQGLAATVDPRDLRLTSAELTALLADRFTAEEVERIAQLTEGWPVAVQMTRLRAGVTMPTRDLLDLLARDGLGLFNYLAERVLEAVTEDQRAFLRDSAILPFISPLSVNALMARDDGFALISSVLRLQPIVTVTGDRELTIRLHPLFRQYMRNELAMLGRSHEDELNRRAAKFFASRGRTLDAVHFALQAEDLRLAVRLFDEAGGEALIFTAGPRKVQTLLAAVPTLGRALSIRLRLTDVVMAAVDGRSRVAADLEAALSAAVAEIGAHPESAGIAAEEWPHWREFALGISRIARELLTDLHDGCAAGTLTQCLAIERLARRHFATSEAYLGFVLALEVLLHARHGRVADAQRNLAEYAALCERNHFAANLPSINPQRGLLAFLDGRFDRAVAFLARPADKRIDGFAEPEVLLAQLSKTLLAVMHYERDEIDAAAALIEDLVTDPDQTLPEILALALRVRVMCLEARGQGGHADVVLRYETKEATQRDSRRLIRYLGALKLELRVRRAALIDANDADLHDLTEFLDAELNRAEASWLFVEQGARAAIGAWIAAGHPDRALQLAHRVADMAASQGHPHIGAVAQILCACATDAFGDVELTRRHLAAALEVTAPNRVVRPYLDLGPGLATHLVRMLTDRGSPAIAEQIRHLLRDMAGMAPTQSSAWSALSERERDILSALGGHTTTKEVARTLGLSPETVKHHLKRIFGKLGVHSREEALRRIAESGE